MKMNTNLVWCLLQESFIVKIWQRKKTGVVPDLMSSLPLWVNPYTGRHLNIRAFFSFYPELAPWKNPAQHYMINNAFRQFSPLPKLCWTQRVSWWLLPLYLAAFSSVALSSSRSELIPFLLQVHQAQRGLCRPALHIFTQLPPGRSRASVPHFPLYLNSCFKVTFVHSTEVLGRSGVEFLYF